MGILHDPWAEKMLRPRWALMDKALRRRPMAGLGRNRTFAWLAARTRFYDDAVTEGLDAGISQIVVLGAGYDSRAWRLARPGVRFFEVDHPATQADKRRRAPTHGPSYVPVDIGPDSLHEALSAAGHRIDQPTLFTVEGLTMYLTEPQVSDLLHTLSRLGATGSRLAVNFGLGVEATTAPSSRAAAVLTHISLMLSGEHVKFRLSLDRATDFLAATGWTTRQIATASELTRHYLAGTTLPINGFTPTAFAMIASTT
jgi:methyltransferase (TIGR00027 family)